MKTKNEFIYEIEYEVWNKLSAKHEISKAILTLDRDIESIFENEIIERLPTSSLTKIISKRKL
jgi:hypothetical protein